MTILAKPKLKKYKRPSGWKSAFILTFSLLLLCGAAALRLMSGFDSESELDKITQAQQNKEDIDKNNKPSYLQVKSIDTVGAFHRQVKPVSFEDVLLEQRNADSEFQDAEFIAARKDTWTVQVMDVSKIEVIRDYLATKEKRDQFAYFRYIADDKTKTRRYILTFDDFNNEAGAKKAIENIEFDLPASITPFPKKFKDYLGVVEQYHLETKVRDLKRSKYRAIVLRKTKAPVYYVNNNPTINTFTDKKAIKPKRRSKKTPATHSQYAKRSMNTNAFKKQPKKTGRVVQTQHKNNKVNNKKPAKPKTADDNISKLINQIN